MTTITDQPKAGQSKDGTGPGGERPWLAAIRDVLDRPLTSYHILLGATGLLLVLGLLMVLSASSVLSLNANGNSYTIFYRQLIWVGVGLPMAYVASRMTPRHFRMLAYVALLGSVFLLVLTYVPGLGVGVKGNTNWLNLGGPLQIQPSEFAKLALVMWCADLYARKQKLLTQWKHLLVPMVPVCGLVIALIIGQHDLGTALVLMAVMLGMIWVVGAPTRLFVATIVGFWFTHCLGRPAMLDEALADLFARVERGELRVVVGQTYGLSEAARAQTDLAERRTTGKLLLDPSR